MISQPEDINALDKRIRRLKEKRQKMEPDAPKSSTANAVAAAFRIGTEFIAAVFVGLCLGYVFDKIFGTKVIFLLVFSVFGCMAGILNVYRSAQEMDKNIQKEKD